MGAYAAYHLRQQPQVASDQLNAVANMIFERAYAIDYEGQRLCRQASSSLSSKNISVRPVGLPVSWMILAEIAIGKASTSSAAVTRAAAPLPRSSHLAD